MRHWGQSLRSYVIFSKHLGRHMKIVIGCDDIAPKMMPVWGSNTGCHIRNITHQPVNQPSFAGYETVQNLKNQFLAQIRIFLNI